MPAREDLDQMIELNAPVACGGVAVYSGDIMVGDEEGVVVIPQHLADKVAKDAAEQEVMEVFILELCLPALTLYYGQIEFL